MLGLEQATEQNCPFGQAQLCNPFLSFRAGEQGQNQACQADCLADCWLLVVLRALIACHTGYNLVCSPAYANEPYLHCTQCVQVCCTVGPESGLPFLLSLHACVDVIELANRKDGQVWLQAASWFSCVAPFGRYSQTYLACPEPLSTQATLPAAPPPESQSSAARTKQQLQQKKKKAKAKAKAAGSGGAGDMEM
eukprot:1038541-Pelagomonas_calceolata.AAC.2